jgi:hypothetical protein
MRLKTGTPKGSDIPTLQAMVAPHRDAILQLLRAQQAENDPTTCSRHGRDYRAFCGESACANAFPDYLPLKAVDHRTGRLWNR